MSETSPQDQPDEAMVDLLIKQVTEGLSPAEQRALDVLDSAVASAYLRDFERAAAAIALSAGAHAEPLPAKLVQRLAHQAEDHFAAADAGGGAVAPAAASARAPARFPAAGAPAAGAPARAASRSGLYGWFAAAACLIVALFAWNRPTPPAPVAATPPSVLPPPVKPAVPTPGEERAALLAKSESVKITFGATKDPASAGVSGDVVWDPVTQRGFLHFVGLAANDPALRQYQLWIFDGGRDQRYPVDGGVFDIPANATEAVIPIHAALPVLSAKAFAVTIEKPGGVVVSGREHVVVLGAAG
jgi:hypothetical protein